ncbi:MAG: glycosyltransferase family 4 protein, partial [Methylohalobius sp.]
MKIAVVAPSPVPFVFGGAERFWLDLVRALNEHTPHEVELMKLPFPERDFWEVLDGYRRFYALDLAGFDLIISTKYPAWMVQHPRHIVYMQHKLRGLYDCYPRHLPSAWPKESALKRLGQLVAEPKPTPAHAEELFGELETLKHLDPCWFAFPGPVAKGVVHFLDRLALRPEAIVRYAAISHTVANRPNYFPPQVKVHVAHHPSGLKVESQPFPDQPIVFTASRLDGPKRLDLLIRAFGRVTLPRAKLYIAGSGPQEASLRRLAAGDERIAFLGRISDFELARAYGKAQVVAFVPEQEDLGLVALEAGLAGRPVITCHDSGGVVELVHDQISGLVVEPKEAALSNALAELLKHPERARALGEAAQKHAAKVSWSEAIAALGLDAAQARPKKTSARPIVVLAPFSLRPPRFGGANRIFHLYRAWAQHTPVHVLSLGAYACQVQISSHFTISEIALSTKFIQHANAWSAKLKVPASDLALLDGMKYLPDYCAAVAEWTAKAKLVVVSHPYCLPALPQGLPSLVYDAHNVEYDLKAQLWQAAEEEWRLRALALVQAAEAEALERAKAVLAVCPEEAERLAALYRVHRPWILAPNGVDLKTRPFLAAEERRKLARRL